jgi:hypothetical membrane protein
MSIGTYLETHGGRVLTIVAGLALAALGILAAAGPGDHVLAIIAAAPPILIAGCLYGVGMTTRTHPGLAAVLLVALPVVAGPYLATMFAVPRAGGAVALVFSALALSLFAIAARAGRQTVRENTAPLLSPRLR